MAKSKGNEQHKCPFLLAKQGEKCCGEEQQRYKAQLCYGLQADAREQSRQHGALVDGQPDDGGDPSDACHSGADKAALFLFGRSTQGKVETDKRGPKRDLKADAKAQDQRNERKIRTLAKHGVRDPQKKRKRKHCKRTAACTAANQQGAKQTCTAKRACHHGRECVLAANAVKRDGRSQHQDIERMANGEQTVSRKCPDGQHEIPKRSELRCKIALGCARDDRSKGKTAVLHVIQHLTDLRLRLAVDLQGVGACTAGAEKQHERGHGGCQDQQACPHGGHVFVFGFLFGGVVGHGPCAGRNGTDREHAEDQCQGQTVHVSGGFVHRAHAACHASDGEREECHGLEDGSVAPDGEEQDAVADQIGYQPCREHTPAKCGT